MKRRVLFVTATRADFGKLKPLMQAVERSENFECLIFVTGMHMMSRYGLTVDEIYKERFTNILSYMNQIHGEPMEMVLANTIHGLSRYLHECPADMIVVHGDRVEALAGAIVGAMRNTLVAHIEGGELSGTVDELIRHSVSKLSHLHFVANEKAAERLRQLGESSDQVFVIGSPDIDVMLSNNLPSLAQVKEYYQIAFDRYALVLLHSVTTEPAGQQERAQQFVTALLESNLDFVVIYPNNDPGSDLILEQYQRVENNPRFRVFPSLRFEYFLTLMKHAAFVIGNSSAGVREAPVYGVPSINVGNRQHNRFCHDSIIESGFEHSALLSAIQRAIQMPRMEPCHHFGAGDSAACFIEVMQKETTWTTPTQKQFNDFDPASMKERCGNES